MILANYYAEKLHLSPVKNEFFLEGKTHGLVIFPSMPEDDHKLDKNPPTLQGVLVVLQNQMVIAVMHRGRTCTWM